MFNILGSTLRFYLTPVRIAITKKTNNKCCPGLGGKKELSHTVGGNVN
jgi:hypothetical protein